MLYFNTKFMRLISKVAISVLIFGLLTSTFLPVINTKAAFVPCIDIEFAVNGESIANGAEIPNKAGNFYGLKLIINEQRGNSTCETPEGTTPWEYSVKYRVDGGTPIVLVPEGQDQLTGQRTYPMVINYGLTNSFQNEGTYLYQFAVKPWGSTSFVFATTTVKFSASAGPACNINYGIGKKGGVGGMASTITLGKEVLDKYELRIKIENCPETQYPEKYYLNGTLKNEEMGSSGSFNLPATFWVVGSWRLVLGRGLISRVINLTIKNGSEEPVITDPNPIANTNTVPTVGNVNTGITASFIDLDANVGSFFNPLQAQSLPELLTSIIRVLFLLISIAAVIIIIIAGFRMVLANGNEEQLTKAKKAITWAIVGLIVSLMSFSIVAIIQNLISRQ